MRQSLLIYRPGRSTCWASSEELNMDNPQPSMASDIQVRLVNQKPVWKTWALSRFVDPLFARLFVAFLRQSFKLSKITLNSAEKRSDKFRFSLSFFPFQNLCLNIILSFNFFFHFNYLWFLFGFPLFCFVVCLLLFFFFVFFCRGVRQFSVSCFD